jgi:hypothetical protein
MGPRKIPTRKRGATKALVGAGAALFAFALYITGSAWETAQRVYELMWHAHELFQRSIPIAAIVAAAAFFLIVYMGYWLHSELLLQSIRSVGNRLLDAFNSGRMTYVLMAGQALVGTTVWIQVAKSPPVHVADKIEVVSSNKLDKGGSSRTTDSGARRMDRTINETVPTITERQNSLPSIDSPHTGTKIARDVCDLSLAFDSEELAVCEQYIRKHPKTKGTGGEIYVLRKLNGLRIIEPLVIKRPPLPKSRPSLNGVEADPGE